MLSQQESLLYLQGSVHNQQTLAHTKTQEMSNFAVLKIYYSRNLC